MSLQVWLPLNGNLNNQGISDAAITNNGATINASGKIGQCYSFDGTDDYLQTTNFDMDNWSEYSIAAWIKPTISSFYLFLVRSGGTHQIRISNDNLMFRDSNNSSQRTVSFNHSFVENQWIHICCVYNRGEIFMYCDGVQTNHSTSYYHANSLTNTGNTEVRIGCSQSSSGNSYYSGFINDFRIYNHALSAKEVEELAKGLILHYKLDNTFFIQELQYDRKIYIEPDGSQWLHIAHHNNPASSGYFNRTDPWETGVYLNQDKWFDINVIKNMTTFEFMVKQKTTASATESKYRWTQNISPFVATYNDVKPGTVTFNTASGYTNSSYGGLWQMNSSARLCIANASSSNWYGAFGCWTAYNTNNVPGFPNSNISTGYMDLYVNLNNYNFSQNNTIYDSSGYENNGLQNNITITGDSSRYLASSSFNGTNSYIKCNTNNWMVNPMTELTINVWIKDSTWPTNGGRVLSCTESGGWNLEGGSSGYWRFPIHVYTAADLSTTAYKYDSKEIQISALSTTDWNMITLVYRANQGTKTYINGQLHHTYNNVSYGIHYNRNARLFLGCEANTASPTSPYYNGYESDFRIYATALTDEQILELYNTSVTIDKNGNVYAREVQEI